MRNLRHLWSGDWRDESEQARAAAEEAAARHRAAADRAGAPPPPPPKPKRGLSRRAVVALVVLSTAGLLSGAFAAGTLIDGGDDGAAALPAVSNTPIKPKKGQTQAGAIYAAASPAVVSVRAGSGSGTGFLIDSDGTIVTNSHVVGRNPSAIIRFGDDGSSIDGRVRGRDPSSDLAVVKVDSASVPKGVKPLRLADSRSVQIGDMAIAIGNPFGLDRTATEGIVSGLGREIQAPNGFQIDSVIQTDAPINPGNSGGPLLDDAGTVIGVNSQIATNGGGGNVGVGFAVPSNTVRQVVPQLQRGEKIERPYLGVETSTVLPGGPEGAEIQSIVPGGPAEKAKLRTGDVITRIDGTDVKNPSDVAEAIAPKQPGDDVEIEVERNGLTEELTAKLGTRPARTP
jgi:putative serine protease PepD